MLRIWLERGFIKALRSRLYIRMVLLIRSELLVRKYFPPALWLFGSGLIGLIGIARRNSRNAIH
jgi:hypothetical protein